jgi:hypothetical protein
MKVRVLLVIALVAGLIIAPIGTHLKYRLVGTALGVGVVVITNEHPSILSIGIGAVSGYFVGEIVYRTVNGKSFSLVENVKVWKQQVGVVKDNVKDIKEVLK